MDIVLQFDIQYSILTIWKLGYLRKAVFEMAIKSANVAARVEPEIKEKAETILSELGIPVSTAINMFYRQVVLWNGIPFRPAIPANRPLARDEMSIEEFNARMEIGFAQAEADESSPADEVFSRLIGEVSSDSAI